MWVGHKLEHVEAVTGLVIVHTHPGQCVHVEAITGLVIVHTHPGQCVHVESITGWVRECAWILHQSMHTWSNQILQGWRKSVCHVWMYM